MVLSKRRKAVHNNIISQRDNVFNIIVGIVCFITNLSQLPIFVDKGLSSPISMGIWVALLAFVLLKSRFSINVKLSELGYFVLFLIFFLFFCFFLHMFTGLNYYRTSLFSSVYLSAFVLLIGYLVGKDVNEKTLNIFATCYIISSAIFGIVVFFQYLFGSDISSRVYAYDSKNSAAQIVLTGVIFIFIFKVNLKKIFFRIMYILLGIFLIYVILLMKSRATIIAIPLVFLMILWMGKYNRKASVLITIGIIAVVIFFLVNRSSWDSLYNNIILGGRDATDFDDISSGRSHEWENFFGEFMESPIIGHGRMKRESVILTALLEYGLFGGAPVLIYTISPLIYAIGKLDFKKIEVQSFLLIAVTYIVNGIFEQLAPFGPGVKCYALWFMMGIFISSHMYDKKIATRKRVWKKG